MEDFKTPEQIAAVGANEDGVLVGHHDPFHDQPQTPKASLKDRIKNFYFDHKKVCLIGGAVFLVLIGIIVFFLLKPSEPTKPAIPPIPKKIPPKAITVPSTLTGLQVLPDINKRTVTGVMIENSMDARPQAGLGEAGVVFEAIAEGGITRFLALFQDTAPENIGPVRSARPYYVEWSMGFDSTYAHVGGSPEALSNIREWGVRDLDQFYNSGAYHRISARAAPHNVYTGIPKLNQLEASKGYIGSTFTGFPRNVKDKPRKVPTARTINLNISGPLYNVAYNYNPKTNSYDRQEGGTPHIDANSNKQISPKVVIAMIVPYGIQSDGKHSQYGVVGSGQAWIFQDGDVQQVNWSKADRKSQIGFIDAAGKPVKLTPGRTWVTALGSAANVNYAP